MQQRICKLRRDARIPANSPAKARAAQSSSVTPKTPTKRSKQAGLETPTKQAKTTDCVVDDSDNEDKDLDVKPIIKVEDEKKELDVVDLDK